MEYTVQNSGNNISGQKSIVSKKLDKTKSDHVISTVPVCKGSKPAIFINQDLATLSRQLACQASLLANNEKYEEAVKLFTQAIALFDSDYRYYGNRSFCYDRLGDYEQALADALSALKLSSTWPKGYFRKGRALAGLKRYVEAEQAYNEVLKLGFSYPDLNEQLHAVRIAHLEDMGFNKSKAEKALENTETLQQALDNLLSERFVKVVASPSKAESTEVNISEVPNTVNDNISNENKKSLWIGNVGLSVTEEHLQNYFEKFGEIVSLKILHSSGCAFVNYKSAESAKSAITASTTVYLADVALMVRYQQKTSGQIPRAPLSSNLQECRYWRSTGCIFGSLCRYAHVPSNKGIDLQILERNPYQSVAEI